MAGVLLVGIDPDAVDFTDPALPPGLDAATIRAGIDRALADLSAAGHQPTHLYIAADPAGLGPLAERLAVAPPDVLLVGGGVRLPPRNLALFETVLNVATRAPAPPLIALAATPADAPAAVERVLALR